MKKLRKLFSGFKQKLFGARYKTAPGELAGRSLRVVRGTLRPQADKDDAWLFWLCGRFERIFDIGANIGQTALIAKVQGPDKRLLAVDANAEALSLAAQNLILNGLSAGCEFVTAFVGDRPDEQVKLYTVGVGAAGSMYRSHATTAAATGQYLRVRTTTLDLLTGQCGWTPELVKIDVEGAEAKVLEGAVGLAALQQTWFMVEMHSPPELPMAQNAALVLEWAQKNRYSAWYMRDACKLNDPQTLADRGRCHLLLLPLGVEYPPELARIKENDPIPVL